MADDAKELDKVLEAEEIIDIKPAVVPGSEFNRSEICKSLVNAITDTASWGMVDEGLKHEERKPFCKVNAKTGKLEAV